MNDREFEAFDMITDLVADAESCLADAARMAEGLLDAGETEQLVELRQKVEDFQELAGLIRFGVAAATPPVAADV